MNFSKTTSMYLEAMAKQRGLDATKFVYKKARALDDIQNDAWEVDTMLTMQHYAHALGCYMTNAAIIHREGDFYVLDKELLTDEQQETIRHYFEALKLEPIDAQRQTVITVGAIETIMFAGMEYVPSPISFSSCLVFLEHDVVVVDVQRMAYRSLVTPSRQALRVDLNVDQLLEQQHSNQTEIERDEQSPSL